jgi:DNA-binding Xre family transcriptional regulator
MTLSPVLDLAGQFSYIIQSSEIAVKYQLGIDSNLKRSYNAVMEQDEMLFTQESVIMPGTIRLLVPQLLKERGQTPTDLMYGARLAPATAYRLADGDAQRISFDVLAALCSYFEVEVDGVLEFVPDENEMQPGTS